MRIDKFLSQMHFCSRKDTISFLKKHELYIEDERVTKQNYDFDPNIQKVFIDGELVYYEDPIHLMIYKPKGYVSAKKDNLYPCVTDLIKAPYDRFDFLIVGRLDVDTEGLLLLTTDGQFLHEITHPSYHLDKTYEVVLDKPFEHQEALLNGVEVFDGKQQPYIAKAIDIEINQNKVYITIDEGKFHQVKRMFLSVGYKVIYLKRTQIGNLTLKDLQPSEYIKIRKSDLYD